MWEGQLEKINEYKFRIPKSSKPGMRVDGIIYANEKLLVDIKRDKAAEQVANVAFLPGIVKYSLAMPDIHWGYGFSIGGVAATDPDDSGVISPGGVGYDINCLCANSYILNELGYRIKIKDYENNFSEKRLACIDFRDNEKNSTEILAFLKRKPKNKVYKIKVSSGREIIATEDHPFYTKDGMKEAGKLSIGEKVALYPFEGIDYQKPSSNLIVEESNIEQFLQILGKEKRGNALAQILNQFSKRKILPLRYNSPQLPYLLKIMGYCFGDGTIYFTNKTGKGVVCFYGKEEDLSDIKNDLERIGFNSAHIYSRGRRHKITTSYSTYEFYRKEYTLKISSSALAVLLGVLGVPVGNKCRNEYSLPKWLFNTTLWQKRLFLSAFFGAELSSPKTLTGHGYNFYSPILSMNKIDKYIQNGKEFLEQISLLLSEFGITIDKISLRKEYVNKEGLVSHRLRLIIDADAENLLKLYVKISG
jgi:tRNA-splicing ligase RtcB